MRAIPVESTKSQLSRPSKDRVVLSRHPLQHHLQPLDAPKVQLTLELQLATACAEAVLGDLQDALPHRVIFTGRLSGPGCLPAHNGPFAARGSTSGTTSRTSRSQTSSTSRAQPYEPRRILPLAALNRAQDVALRQRLQVIGDLPHPLVEGLRQLPRRKTLGGAIEKGGEDPPAQRVADGADQL